MRGKDNPTGGSECLEGIFCSFWDGSGIVKHVFHVSSEFGAEKF